MIWHIARREIHQNLTTLRFALMMILLPILMVVNALIYSLGDDGYMAQVNIYNQRVEKQVSHIKEYASKGLGELAQVGPGEIPKYPSRLTFCADGVDELIPRHVTMQSLGKSARSGQSDVEDYSWRLPWILEYSLRSEEGSTTQSIKLDWIFIGILMNFFSILFTFDAIAGERTRGTLSLIMSNQISRGQVLLGKCLGAFFTLLVPFSIGILINLLIILITRSVPFDLGDWLRILGMMGIFALHISIFIFLGLFFSSRVSNAVTSLVLLLLTWGCLAFVFPSLLGTFVGNLNPIPSVDEVSMRRETQWKQINDEFRPFGRFGESTPSKLSKAASPEDLKATRQWAVYLTTVTEMRTQFADEHINQQFRQVRLARDLTQISPIACFQYAMEGLAGTGIMSYMNFIKQVRRYRQTFIDFIKTEDRSDPESLYVYPVKEGLSQRLVNPNTVPRFEEHVSYENVFFPTGLLVIFNLLFFILAYVSFLKSDVK